MNNIAIIPARGGSKRIPRKSIKDFLGKPIMAYSIETALESQLFEEVMVSTDDEEIAEIARAYGAKVPFLRSSATSDDYATTASVLEEVIHNYEKSDKSFTYSCCIYPTAPLIKAGTLRDALTLLKGQAYDAVFPVLRYGYPIWRSLKIEDSRAVMNWPEYLNSRSQDLQPAFHDAGQFYFFHVKQFLQKRTLFTDHSGAIELSELEAQDIDNLTDWKLAELKYKLIHQLE